MGNAIKKKKKTTSIKELNHTILLFIGNNEVLRAKCINDLVKYCHTNQSKENITFSYKLNGFIINEQSNGCDSSSSYPHLDIACKNSKPENVKSVHHKESLPSKLTQDKALLIFAYIRSIKVDINNNIDAYPMDIIKMISEYVRLPTVDSFLLEMHGKTYELWNLYDDDKNIWSQLFKYADGVILNVDLCDYKNAQDTLNLLKYVSGIQDNHKEPLPAMEYILILDNVTEFKNKINTGSFSSIEEYNASSNFNQQIETISNNLNREFLRMTDPLHILYTHLADQETHQNKNIYEVIFWDVTHIVQEKYNTHVRLIN